MTIIIHHLTLDDMVRAVRYRHAQNEARPSATVDAISAHAPPPAGADLVTRLRQLCLLAEQSAGADWVAATADAVVHAVLGLQRLERDSVDPRRRVSLAKAARMGNTVKSMRETGHTHADAVAALCVRERLSRGQVYALLRMNVCGDITVQKAG